MALWPMAIHPALSLYDTAALEAKLNDLVDFDFLNDRGARISIGTTDIDTGNLVYFDGNSSRIDARLVLSCLAALQAPVIMMSQRRQETKDRFRAENDYRVNLKSELEIRQLHEKIDHQLARQWEKLVELQQIQIELLEENADGRR